MTMPPTHQKRRFVSASARQQRRVPTNAADLPPVASKSLRDRDDGATRWPTALGTSRQRTNRDDLCAAYFQVASGFQLRVDEPIRTEDHLLVVVTEGALVIESAGCPFAVREGESALVPPGAWRITEAPAAGQIGYWLLFFSPALLVEAIGDDAQVQQLAAQVVPAYQGVYVQPRLLSTLHM